MVSKLMMPKIGDMMETGAVSTWLKQVGDPVKRGEVVLEITTDKATLEVEAFVEGTFLRILVGEGEEVPVGTPLAIIGDSEDEITEDMLSGSPAPQKQEPAEEVPEEIIQEEVPAIEMKSTDGPAGRVKASPRAKRVAREKNVDISTISGTGPGGRIVERDILAVAAEGSPSVRATPLARKIAEQKGVDLQKTTGSGIGGKITKDDVLSYGEPMKLSPMRKVIAERMSSSKREAPHFYLIVDVDMSRATAAREELNDGREKQDKISYNDLVVFAVARGISEMPNMLGQWQNGGPTRASGVNVGVAVSVEEGLMVPVVKNAHGMDINALSSEIKDLAAKARNKKLRPDDYSGGCFTVTNLGMFGIDEFLAIINPPESAILSVGAIKKTPVVVNDQVAIRPICKLCLSADHRVVDGAEGAKFLTRVKHLLEHPLSLFMGS